MSELTARLTAALADRYWMERELGQGGMATVYLAEDLKHDRKVALKVLKPELAAVLGAERFVQEIKTTANLQHPHILPLFDSGIADGFLYYVMPFIDGETLRSKLNRETQLGIEEAVGITTSIADALDYAHRHGVIHRDIKPENILLHDGRPMVADFGIALAVSAAAGGRMTETGLSLGTPHYMSPEQATAEKELTYDLALATFSRLTSAETVTSAEWSADGSRVLFTAAGEESQSAVWSQVASGGAQAEKLFEHAVLTPMATMSPDGKSLLVNSIPEVSWDIFRVPLDSERVARSHLTTRAHEHAPQFSPDGKWVTLVSDESGRDEVYVRSFPDPSSKTQISVAGGFEPAWSRDGSRLYYRSGSLLLAARISFSPTFALLARDTVLSNATFLGGYFSGSYQPARDGRRILAILPDRDDFQLVVSPNWITELRRRVGGSSGR